VYKERALQQCERWGEEVAIIGVGMLKLLSQREDGLPVCRREGLMRSQVPGRCYELRRERRKCKGQLPRIRELQKKYTTGAELDHKFFEKGEKGKGERNWWRRGRGGGGRGGA